jgi:hypothetical protein
MNADSEHINTTPLLNRAAVKAMALAIASDSRAQGFTRVGMSFLERIQAKTAAAVREEVLLHPSKGKTLL